MTGISKFTNGDGSVDLASARVALGLSLNQMAYMLDTDLRSVSRFEAPKGSKSHRDPAVRVVRLVDAYLDGWRPADWPGVDTPMRARRKTSGEQP